ncbi:MAG: universal stress protein [Alphaproteobacteria bacterium]
MSDTATAAADEANAPDGPGDQRVFLVVVDDTPEMKVALRYASLRARRTGGRVALLRVIDKADFQHWAAVGALMREEARTAAEQLIQELAAIVVRISGQIPILYIAEGDPKQVLLELIDGAPEIKILVLAAAPGSNPGPLISFLTKRNIGRLRIPVTLVPGGLSDGEIDALT